MLGAFFIQSENATLNYEGNRASIIGETNLVCIGEFRFMDPVALIVVSLYKFLEIYGYLLIARILLSWFQTAEWAQNIISFLSPITDPYLNIFRSIIPPLGGIDFSAILAIIALQFIQSALAPFITRALI